MPEPNTGCLLWLKGVDDWGYGTIKIDKKMKKAHRVAWALYNGEIPDGLKILHRCDTPPCINPNHLFLGTDQENNDDMVRKGRRVQVYGEDWPQAKLTEDQVLEIRASKENRVFLGKKYNVHRDTITDVILRRTWRYL